LGTAAHDSGALPIRGSDTTVCQFLPGADQMPYESRTRSIRIHGLMTSIRLEHLIWDALAAIAVQEGLTANARIMPAPLSPWRKTSSCARRS
jgi:hypothetical protein